MPHDTESITLPSQVMTGLGFSVIKGIASNCGVTVQVSTKVGSGACHPHARSNH